MAELTDVLNEYAHTLYTGLKDAIPQEITLLEELPFDKTNEQGGDYTEHIITAEEAGFVHGDATEMMTAPTAVGMETVKATVNGYQVGMVSTLDYAKAQRASNSKKAYADIAGKKQASGFNAIRRRVEDELWWGQYGLGKIASSANTNTTTTVLTITLAHWAPWLWAGKKNHTLVVYNASTRVGSGLFTITGVNLARGTRTITVTGSTGDISSLDSTVAGAADTLDLYWGGTVSGSLSFKTMVGLYKAASTTSGTLFGVTLADNPDVIPQTYSAGTAAMSFAKALEAAEVMIGRGVVEALRADFSIRTWNNMMTDQAALKRYQGKEKKLSNGADALEFNCQGVTLEITSNGRMKESLGILRPKSSLKRIGAREISMVTPGSAGSSKGDIWYHDPSRFGYSWRIWTHQAFFAEEPWRLCSISGIVNT
jgi:hypothetical protein